MKRFFSADFHLGFGKLMQAEKWPFNTVEEYRQMLLAACSRAGKDDAIVHVGDLSSSSPKDVIAANQFIKSLDCVFINIKGNHDGLGIKSLCESMRTQITRRFPSVSVSHYPTYRHECYGHYQHGDIHLCGHVHSSWRHCLDIDNQCLNINVGCMVWNFGIISEEEIANYINKLLRYKPQDLFRCRKNEFGANKFFPCRPEIDSDIFFKK